MRKITQAHSAVCLLFALNTSVTAHASSPSPLYPGTDVAKLAEQAPIHWVSVAQIENSLLGHPPMAVGFDIDDTVLFSSPGFWRGQKNYSPNSQDYLKNPEFWEKMNNGWDEFSIPKEVARALIAMQTADAFNIATPADWVPGDDVIISPAGTCGGAKNRMDGKEDMVCQDWFFCERKLSKEKVLSAVLKKKPAKAKKPAVKAKKPTTKRKK